MGEQDTYSTGAACGVCCTRLEQFSVVLGSVTILSDIHFHMHCGQLTVLVGPNGAGKTTLLRAMLGELPHQGTLHFVPVRVGSRDEHPRIGYVPQRLDLDNLSPATVLDLFGAALSRRPVWTGVSRSIAEEARQKLAMVGAETLLHQRIGRLSGGQLQRVLLALALTPTPDILLLDEPVSGVDPAGIELFYQKVSQLRRDFDLSILLISHDLATASRYADRMIFLNHTILCDGTPREVLSNPLVQKTFGLAFDATSPQFVPNPAPAHHSDKSRSGR